MTSSKWMNSSKRSSKNTPRQFKHFWKCKAKYLKISKRSKVSQQYTQSKGGAVMAKGNKRPYRLLRLSAMLILLVLTMLHVTYAMFSANSYVNEFIGADSIDIDVTKICVPYAGHPDSIEVQLYRNSVPYGGPVVVGELNDWRYTWTDLDKNAVWTVDEVLVPDGYVKTIAGGMEQGYVITDTKTTTPPTTTPTPPGPTNPPGPTPTPPGPTNPPGPTPTPPGPTDPNRPTPTPPGPTDPNGPTPTPPGPTDPNGPTPTPPGPNDPNGPTPTPPGPTDPNGPTPTPPDFKPPKTGDNTDAISWLLLLAICTAILRYVLFFRKCRKCGKERDE
ncbi:MAG: Cna B-type domain-containing protein [Oscillospiraceae bacterium]|jgi:hypothetical protein|nr:Cna B-type domain-containing protein [Oscillospiraceae bacterium]